MDMHSRLLRPERRAVHSLLKSIAGASPKVLDVGVDSGIVGMVFLVELYEP
jgi:hypothetical protein